VFANTANGQGYDLVLFGQLGGGKINVDDVQKRLSDPANQAIAVRCARLGSTQRSICSGPMPVARLTWRTG
jgi:hypothetical protein